jgi:hypothetical protein
VNSLQKKEADDWRTGSQQQLGSNVFDDLTFDTPIPSKEAAAVMVAVHKRCGEGSVMQGRKGSGGAGT